MAKKLAKPLLIVVLICLIVLTLVACKEEESTHKGKVSYDITNIDEFINISNKLGADYDEATFYLKNDIDFSGKWIPIGDSIENSFRGRLDGGGNTITLTVKNGEYTQLEESHFGLFGYIYGAVIENLTLVIDYQLESDIDISYIGGISGVAYGKNTITNVNIDGAIDIMPGYREEYLPDLDHYTPLIDKRVYIGSLFAYGVGEFDISSIDASLQVLVPYNNENDYFSFENVFVGGLVGYMRTVDLSNKTVRNKITDVTIEPQMDIKSVNAFIGGGMGIAYNADIQNLSVNGGNTVGVVADKHAYVGGALGLVDNCTFDEGFVSVNLDVRYSYVSSITAYAIGGGVGFVENYTTISNLTIDDVSISTRLPKNSEAYGGGIVGVVRDSVVKDSTVTGGFVIDGKTTPQAFLDTATSASNIKVVTFAGGVGMLYGESKLESIDVDFTAYQGMVSVLAPSIEIIMEKDSEGKDKVKGVEVKMTPEFMDTYYSAEKTGAYYYNGYEIEFQPNEYGEGIIPAVDDGEESDERGENSGN